MGVSCGSIDWDIVTKINLWKKSKRQPCWERLFTPLVPSFDLTITACTLILNALSLSFHLFEVCLNSRIQCRTLLWPPCWPHLPLTSEFLTLLFNRCIPYTALVSYFTFAYCSFSSNNDEVEPWDFFIFLFVVLDELHKIANI